MTLKEIINKEFGLDLPITGGSGQGPDEPVVIEVRDPFEAGRVEMEIVSAVNGMLGHYWCSVGKERLAVSGRSLERLDCEVKRIEGGEVLTERRSLYFELPPEALQGGKSQTAMIFLGERQQVSLPYEIGWLHYVAMVDNEEEEPGQGVTVAYAAPGINASVTVYDRQLPAVDWRTSPEAFRKEFERAVEEISGSYEGITELATLAKPNLLFKAFEIGGAYSVLQLSTAVNRFMKLRITLHPPIEQHAFECVKQSLSFFSAMVGANPMN